MCIVPASPITANYPGSELPPVCTLTIAWQVFDAAPIVVAANRDEALDRPSARPAVYATDPVVVAPRDARAGGTWIGISEHDCFVGITNRWTDATLAGDRSRGQLVADVLSRPSAAAGRSMVERAVRADEYEGFNLVLADRDGAFCLEWDGELHVTSFEPGVHVVVNTGFDDHVDTGVPPERRDVAAQQAENARAVSSALTVDPEDTTGGSDWVGWLERAREVLADHDYGVCIHEDGYGTRSSSLIAAGPWGRAYAFADGPPCRTPYRPVDARGVTVRSALEAALEGHL